MHRRPWHAAIVVVAGLLGGLGLSKSARADDVPRARAELYRQYSARLDELARWCDEHKLTPQAQRVRSWLPKRDPLRTYVYLPPAKCDLPAEQDAASGDAPASDSAALAARFARLRREQAAALFSLARRAATAGDVASACELLWETAAEDPDHAAARRALGFERHEGRWLTPFALRQAQAGRAWHQRFGWLAADDVAKYESGQRRLGGRWISADEDAKRHGALGGGDVSKGWRVETEHFLLTTNHSLEEGVRLADRLEQLHHAWQVAFAGYWLPGDELLRRIDGASPSTKQVAPKHRVTYFRTRDEYVRALRPTLPRVEMSLGVYMDAARTAYFFAGKDQDPGTVLHEATHQLFRETAQAASNNRASAAKTSGGSTGIAAKPLLVRNNFWIVEAAACYMESLAPLAAPLTAPIGSSSSDPRGDRRVFTLGGLDAGRVPAARERVLDDGFYVPLSELVELGGDRLQSDPRIAKLYSQSAGLATFLVHADGARYRPALVRYLQSVYAGKATPTTLAELTGARLDELDRQYRLFLQRGR